jgi:hypothetical protein
LSMSSLTAKSGRVAILWYSRGPIAERNRCVRARVLLFGVFLAVVILITLLIAWQVTAPWTLTLATLQTDEFQNPLASSAVCTSNSTLSTVYLALVVTYICVLAGLTGVVSFWVRNAPEKYQETKMTAIAGICMLQVFFMGVPTAAAVWILPLPRFLVLSSMTFLLCMIILVAMFLPKKFKSRFLGDSTKTQEEEVSPAASVILENTGNTKSVKESSRRLRPESDVKAFRSVEEMDKQVEEEKEKEFSLVPKETPRNWEAMMQGITAFRVEEELITVT